jgi:hypothetical protein
VTPFVDASSVSSVLALVWSSIMRCAYCLTLSLEARSSASRAISTSAIPPAAAVIMNLPSDDFAIVFWLALALAFAFAVRLMSPLVLPLVFVFPFVFWSC